MMDNRAPGAGLLVGWTARGDRPEFSMVTGVSTGALTAPFAFLGSDYDDEMQEVYTSTTTKDIAEKRNLFSAALGDSVTDTALEGYPWEQAPPDFVLEP